MATNRSPFEGQWRCKTCDRLFGRHFKQCAYCPHGTPSTPTPGPGAAAVVEDVGRPARGVTARVWAILDDLGAAATLSALLTRAVAENINESTARTQFSRCKRVSRST